MLQNFITKTMLSLINVVIFKELLHCASESHSPIITPVYTFNSIVSIENQRKNNEKCPHKLLYFEKEEKKFCPT